MLFGTQKSILSSIFAEFYEEKEEIYSQEDAFAQRESRNKRMMARQEEMFAQREANMMARLLQQLNRPSEHPGTQSGPPPPPPSAAAC